MAIHVTPIPRLTVLATPAFTLGTTNTAGDATSAVASNSTLLTYDTTDPAAVAGAAAVGSAATAARRDHVHVGGPFAAVAKAWVRWEQTGTHSMAASYQMNSVTDGGGAGNSDLLWATSFSSSNYAIVANSATSYTIGTDAGAGAPSTTGVTTITFDTNSQAGTDLAFNYLAAFGDQ